MVIKALNKNIVVKRIEGDNSTEEGIILPESQEDEIARGDVIEVAPDVKDIKVMDRVLFKKYSPDVLKVGDKDYQIVKYEDILGIILDDNGKQIAISKDFEGDTLQPNNPKFNKKYPK